MHYYIVFEVELRSSLVEVDAIVCKASETSCCKFVGKVFISLGYSSKCTP